MITAQTTPRELAFTVCSALHESGVTAVLTGGGAATVYAPESYQSRDLDFVLSYHASPTSVEQALLRLGFEGKAGSYRHPGTPLTLDFPAGPLAIGEEVVTDWATLYEDDLRLDLLTPTDCVRDRLAWFLFNNDYSSLEQALAVARAQRVDVGRIRDWAGREGESHKFAVFLSRLSG